MQPFLALITPVGNSGGTPSHPIVEPPPYPSHPWVPPVGSPPGYWGGAPLPVPTPPIYYPPQPPLGIWGGAPLPTPTPPIYLPPGVNVPVFPSHPIAPGGLWGLSDSGRGHPIWYVGWETVATKQFNNDLDGDGRVSDEETGDLKGYEFQCAPGRMVVRGYGNGGRLPDGWAL